MLIAQEFVTVMAEAFDLISAEEPEEEVVPKTMTAGRP